MSLLGVIKKGAKIVDGLLDDAAEVTAKGFDEAAWLKDNPHPVKGWPERPVSDFSPEELKKHNSYKTRKSKAKRLSTAEGRESFQVAQDAFRSKYANNPELFERDHPNPFPGRDVSSLNATERKKWEAYKTHRHRAGLAEPIDVSKRNPDFDMGEFVRVNGERPHPGINIKDLTPEQLREYNNWKTRLTRARKNPEALEEARRLDAERQQVVRDARTPEESEEYKAWLRQYRKDNPEITMESDARKRAQRLKRIPKWQTDEHRQRIGEIYDIRKRVSEITGEPFHVDHILPMQGKKVSGLHTPDNLFVMPAMENMRKQAGYTPGQKSVNGGIRQARALLKRLEKEHGLLGV